MEAQVPARDAVVKPGKRRASSGEAGSPVGFSSTRDREIVQRRIALTYGLLAVLLFAFWVFGMIAGVVLAPAQAVELDASKVMYLATVVVLAATWRVCSRRPLPWSVLGVVDGVSLLSVTAILGVWAVFAPDALRPEELAVTLAALIVTLRAALVPAPPVWTATVSGVATVPLMVSAWVLMRAGRGASEPFPGMLGVSLVVALCAMVTSVAWAISRVVYGLRVQIKSAMRLGQYTLEEKIGERGMGVVYRARHALLRRPTALKLLPIARADDLGSRRFEREVQLTSGLTHPNTVAIYDYGHTHDGVFYYAMELLDGLTLAELSDEDGPQPPGRVIRILSQAARALAEAHGVGLVHRDVKPANIFLCVRGGIHDFVKVLDFGLVKEVDAPDGSLSGNTVAGTPLYMAPESISRPDDVDARADIYALGAVGYALLTGEPPFVGKNAVEVYHAHLYEAPRAPSERLGRPLPDALQTLVLACLAKSPGDRPASANDLADSLDALEAAHPWTKTDARAWWTARRPKERPATAVIGDPALTGGLGATAMPTVTLTVREPGSS